MVAVTATGSRITAELLSEGYSSAQAWIEVASHQCERNGDYVDSRQMQG